MNYLFNEYKHSAIEKGTEVIHCFYDNSGSALKTGDNIQTIVYFPAAIAGSPETYGQKLLSFEKEYIAEKDLYRYTALIEILDPKN